MDDLDKFLLAVGALSEATKVFFDNLIGQGFEHDDAIRLTGAFIMSFNRNERNVDDGEV